MSTNFGYAPRPLGQYVSDQDMEVLNELNDRNLRKNTVYVLANQSLWTEMALLNQSAFDAIEIDGFYLIFAKK
jgi:hypothetical protein